MAKKLSEINRMRADDFLLRGEKSDRWADIMAAAAFNDPDFRQKELDSFGELSSSVMRGFITAGKNLEAIGKALAGNEDNMLAAMKFAPEISSKIKERDPVQSGRDRVEIWKDIEKGMAKALIEAGVTGDKLNNEEILVELKEIKTLTKEEKEFLIKEARQKDRDERGGFIKKSWDAGADNKFDPFRGIKGSLAETIGRMRGFYDFFLTIGKFLGALSLAGATAGALAGLKTSLAFLGKLVKGGLRKLPFIAAIFAIYESFKTFLEVKDREDLDWSDKTLIIIQEGFKALIKPFTSLLDWVKDLGAWALAELGFADLAADWEKFSFTEWIDGLIDGLFNWFRDVRDRILPDAIDAAVALYQDFKEFSFVDWLKEVRDSFLNWMKDIATVWLPNKIRKEVDSMKEWGTEFGAWWKSLTGSISAALNSFLASALEKVADVVDKVPGLGGVADKLRNNAATMRGDKLSVNPHRGFEAPTTSASSGRVIKISKDPAKNNAEVDKRKKAIEEIKTWDLPEAYKQERIDALNKEIISLGGVTSNDTGSIGWNNGVLQIVATKPMPSSSGQMSGSNAMVVANQELKSQQEKRSAAGGASNVAAMVTDASTNTNTNVTNNTVMAATVPSTKNSTDNSHYGFRADLR